MKLKFLPILITLFICQQAFGQLKLKGKVSDARTGKPISGANIRMGEFFGAVSGSGGEFEMQVDNTNSVLVVSHMGYRNKTVAVIDNGVVDILLEESQGEQLDEVKISSKYYKACNLKTVSSALRLQSPLINLSSRKSAVKCCKIRLCII